MIDRVSSELTRVSIEIKSKSIRFTTSTIEKITKAQTKMKTNVGTTGLNKIQTKFSAMGAGIAKDCKDVIQLLLDGALYWEIGREMNTLTELASPPGWSSGGQLLVV